MSFCSFCGKEIINPNAVICMNCGGAVGKSAVPPTDSVEKWDVGGMVALCILACFIPLAGWIIGGINIGSQERRQQAIILIVIASCAFIFDLVLTCMFFATIDTIATGGY
jgi:hypothetical protein